MKDDHGVASPRMGFSAPTNAGENPNAEANGEPRLVPFSGVARTPAGLWLQPCELRLLARAVADYLMYAVWAHLLLAAGFYALVFFLRFDELSSFVTYFSGAGLVSLVLCLWAKHQPLAATISALVLVSAALSVVFMWGSWRVKLISVTKIIPALFHLRALSLARAHARVSREITEASSGPNLWSC